MTTPTPRSPPQASKHPETLETTPTTTGHIPDPCTAVYRPRPKARTSFAAQLKRLFTKMTFFPIFPKAKARSGKLHAFVSPSQRIKSTAWFSGKVLQGSDAEKTALFRSLNWLALN